MNSFFSLSTPYLRILTKDSTTFKYHLKGTSSTLFTTNRKVMLTFLMYHVEFPFIIVRTRSEGIEEFLGDSGELGVQCNNPS